MMIPWMALCVNRFFEIFFGHALWTRPFGRRVDGAAPRGFLRFLSLTAFQAEGCGIALRAMSFIMPPAAGSASFGGSPSRNDTVRNEEGRSLDSEYHGSGSYLSPMPSCGSARDDGGGGRHTVISEEDE